MKDATSLIQAVVCVLNTADMLGFRDRESRTAFETVCLAVDSFGHDENTLRQGLFDIVENGQDLFADSGEALAFLADLANAITEHDRFESNFGL